MVKGVGLRLLSRRGSCVQIPPSAPKIPLSAQFMKLLNFAVLCNSLSFRLFLSEGKVLPVDFAHSLSYDCYL